jgi:XRE family transcriptional regulator, fatty acid utilization regulator
VLEVKRLRQQREWNQTELAYHAGLAPSVISQIENGKRDPTARTLRKLAEALSVEVGDLFPKGQAAPSPEQPDFDGLLEEERRRAEREKLIEALPGWIRAAVEDEEFVQRFEVAKSSLARAQDLLIRQRKETNRILAQLRERKERDASPSELQAASRDLAQAKARETACTFMDVDLWRGLDVADVRPVDIVAEVAAAQGDIVAALSYEADDFASEAG